VLTLTQSVVQIGQWIQGIQTAYKENTIFKASIDTLVGALVAFASVQVFSAFIAGARAAIVIIGSLIQALKALTAANLLAGVAGFLKGKPALIAALVAGLGVGIDAAFNQGKIINGITRGITGALDQAFAGFGAMMPKMPALPSAAAGAIPDLSGLQTEKKAKKAKEITEITAQELQLSMLLNKAKIDGNTLLQAELEYGLTLLDIDKQKIGVRRRQQLEANAATTLFKTQIDFAQQVGAAVAQDFMKRQELQENYNRTVEDLKIKAGMITGEKLKELEIDRELETIIQRLPGLTDAQIAKLRELILASQDVKKSFKETFGESLKQYYEQLTNLGAQVADSVKGAFQGLEDQLVNFVTTGKASFADLAKSIIADIARIAIRQAIIAPLLKGVGGIFGLKFADGGVFAQNGIQKFARGGIVDKPTLFPFAKGTGLMGEAGPEAIMPLQRAANGKLCVIASGGGSTSVVVNVDASGNANVQGDQSQAKQLGLAVSAAVQAELIKQKRPGGLLAA
jgi:lambda family phage tail tape measure protein